VSESTLFHIEVRFPGCDTWAEDDVRTTIEGARRRRARLIAHWDGYYERYRPEIRIMKRTIVETEEEMS
jgi:hypothetical protein